jgi:hypothetical protein
VERVLFGNNVVYKAWRDELRGAYAFSRFKAPYEPRLQVTRTELANVASPAPSITPDGRLDAGPNPTYDVPTVDSDLPTLPIRQRVLIQTIKSDLPPNAPKHLRASLDNYDDELRAQGVQPILGVLKDMAEIIQACVGATSADREWLEEGMKEAFARFAANHVLFVQHFPLDPKREDLYARTRVNEGEVTGRRISKPFEEVAAASREANEAGLTTDNFLRIVDKMAEFAVVVSTLPPQPKSASLTRGYGAPPAALGGAVEVDDITIRQNALVSPKKRILLSGFGFLERACNLLASSVTLIGPPQGISSLKRFATGLAVYPS